MWAIAVMALGAPSLERSRRNLVSENIFPLKNFSNSYFQFVCQAFGRSHWSYLLIIFRSGGFPRKFSKLR